MPAAYLLAKSTAPAHFCGKVIYLSRPEAMRAMKKLNRDIGVVAVGRGRLHSYRCTACKGWHLGHSL